MPEDIIKQSGTSIQAWTPLRHQKNAARPMSQGTRMTRGGLARTSSTALAENARIETVEECCAARQPKTQVLNRKIMAAQSA
jgi:hypothetical protein